MEPQEIPETEQLSHLKELEQFLSNKWFFHFAARLRDASKRNESFALNSIPTTDGEARLREQCIGERRGLIAFEKIANTTLEDLKATQNEPDRNSPRTDSDDEY